MSYQICLFLSLCPHESVFSEKLLFSFPKYLIFVSCQWIEKTDIAGALRKLLFTLVQQKNLSGKKLFYCNSVKISFLIFSDLSAKIWRTTYSQMHCVLDFVETSYSQNRLRLHYLCIYLQFICIYFTFVK